MTKITGTVKQFKNMFEIIMCGNKYPLFSNVLLEIDQETISVNSMDQTRSVMTNQKYTGFNIEGGANIPIETISIYEAIKLFNDNDLLTFIYDDNRIVLSVDSGNKHDTITIPTFNVDEFDNPSQITFGENSITINGNEMNFAACVTVNSSYIRDQIRKASYVNDSYHEYIINIDENKLKLIVGDPNNYETSSSTEIMVEEGSGKAQSSYAHGYEDIFKSLNGDVVIHINDTKPMLVIQTTDEYSAKFLIAPTIRS